MTDIDIYIIIATIAIIGIGIPLGLLVLFTKKK